MQRHPKRKIERQKEAIRSDCFDLARDVRILSRSDFSAQVGLSKATASAIAQEFLQAGLLREIGRGDSRGGRRPMLLEFMPGARFAIGIVEGRLAWEGVRTNLDGEIVQRARAPLRGRGPTDCADVAVRLVEELRSGVVPGSILGIGIGGPGQIDTNTRSLKATPSLGRTEDYPLGAMIEARVGLPVFLVNAGRVGALGEYYRGVGRGMDCLVFVALGELGLVAGIVLKGKLYSGASSLSGELGHVTVAGEPLCYCGNRGCLERLVSGDAILAQVREKLRARPESPLSQRLGGDLQRLNLPLVAESAKENEPVVSDVIATVADTLAIGLGNLIDLLNPQVVVIGGPVGTLFGESLVSPLRNATRRRTLSPAFNAVRIETAQLGADAQLIGAATLVLQSAQIASVLR
ncbi:MAG: ROK family protein [Anaerolineae bacterium]|nr:ROK family protein [Anaerolineae bacterium]